MAVTVDDSWMDPPDTNIPGGDDTTSSGDLSNTVDGSVPDATQVGAAATDLTQTPNDNGNSRTGGLIGPPGMPDQLTTPDQQGLFAQQPSEQAAAQGAPGFASVPSYTELQASGGYPQNQPTDYGSRLPGTLPGSGGGGSVQDRGSQLLAAGPGWAIDSTGRFSSTNTPDYVRQNQGWQGGYIGSGTIVQTHDIQNAGYDPATGTFHEGFGGNQDRGFRSYGAGANGQPSGGPMGFGGQYSPLDPTRAPDFSQYGPQPLQGGLYGGWQPGQPAYGAGANMEYNGGEGSQQAHFNAGVGPAIAGGAAGGGNPQYAAWFSDNPQAPNQARGSSGAPYGQGPGITGVMNPDGAFSGFGGLPGNRTLPAATDQVVSTRPTNAGPPGSATSATGNPLMDQGQIMRNPDGSIRGVASPNGSFTQAFQGYDNILRNAQQGDPFALRDAKVLAAAGDQNAKAVVDAIGGLPDFARSQMVANQSAAHNQQIGNRIASGEFLGNQAATAAISNQRTSVAANPASNFDSLLGPDAHAQAMAALNQMGATQVKVQDGKLSWVSASGAPNEIPFSITNSGALVQALQGDAAARQQIASQNTGGGGRGRGYGGYGGGGGNSAPTPAAPNTGDYQNALFDGRFPLGEGGIPDVAQQPTYRGNVVEPNSPLGRRFAAY